jgi:alpha-amylase/alpha-mannosidase (GH57 family)
MTNATTNATARATHSYLCIHGHFYQPPREDPFTGRIPHEYGAGPYDNFNEKITAECYRPNAEGGNFDLISFDLGPTLAAWLEQAHPDVYRRILEADRRAVARYGVGNAIAQAYNHTILPLANARDKRTQIIWGLLDFSQRFGREAEGMWLAETAVDLETLDLVAAQGVRFTVLAPWQAAEPVDTTEPYLVNLPSGRGITVFFYNGPLSGAVSFDGGATNNADGFVDSWLAPQLGKEKAARGEDQLITIASDGELYGHHKPFRDRFLAYLLGKAAPSRGFAVVSLARYLRDHPPTRTVRITAPSAWSCAHGVARWGAGCSCTEGETAWKPQLRAALDHLAVHLAASYERHAAATLRDPWAARDAYLAVRNGWMTADAFWARYGLRKWLFRNRELEQQTLQLLEAQYFGQAMYTSCGWFFEDLDRIEPRNDIAYARRAISLTWQATGEDLQAEFLAELASAKSWRTARTGAELYLRLPRRTPEELPPLRAPRDESAA